MNLFLKTTRRTYTPEYLAKFPNQKSDWDWSYPVWAESADAVRSAHKPSMGEYWDAQFQDVLVSVKPMDEDEEHARMLRADTRNQRCCERAVLYPCVCSIAFTCPEHGQRCHGSHD